MKILIEVRGGTVVSVLCSEDSEIVIVDYDNVDNGENPVSEIMEPDNVYPVMYELFTDEPEVRDELKRLHF